MKTAVNLEEQETASASSWTELVEKIRSEDASGLEELYKIFSRGVRFTMWRRIGQQDLDDRVHETFVIVTQAIRKGELREPERLMGFVRTVMRRQVAAHIENAIHLRKGLSDFKTMQHLVARQHDPEWTSILRQEEEIAWRVLGGISRRHREILIRFYLQEQTQQEICQEMNLTETQFRLLKSRAKARFGELGRRRLVLKMPGPRPEAPRQS